MRRTAAAALALGITLTCAAPASATLAECEQAKRDLVETTANVTVECKPASYRATQNFGPTVGGWYAPDGSVLTVITEYDYLIYKAIILHELGHYHDWYHDPAQGWSSTPRGVDIEYFAIVYAWMAQGRYIPPGTPAPVPVPSEATLAAWRADGFLPAAFIDPPVRRLYLAAFLREPEQAGMDFWLSERAKGRDLWSIAQHFTVSLEFRLRYGTLSDARFVRQIYLNVLGREPDAAGQAWWTARLAEGKSRGWVLVGFSQSPEYKEATS